VENFVCLPRANESDAEHPLSIMLPPVGGEAAPVRERRLTEEVQEASNREVERGQQVDVRPRLDQRREAAAQ
jgi:hypothetical protein